MDNPRAQRSRSTKVIRSAIRRGYIVTVLAVLAAAIGWSGSGGEAIAGTYTVRQCDYEKAITATAFVWESVGIPAPVQHPNTGCTEFGLALRTGGTGASLSYPAGSFGGYSALAPADTEFTHFSGYFGTLSNCCADGMEIYAEARQFADGSGGRTEIFHGPLGSETWVAPAGVQGPVRHVWNAEAANFGAQKIGYFIRCESTSVCSKSTSGDVRLRARSFEFSLVDAYGPELSELAGDLIEDGWIRGVRTLAIEAEDRGGGLARVSAAIDAVPVLESSSACAEVEGSYVELRPCPLVRSGSWTVDTRLVDDGSATLRVTADDVAEARVEEVRQIKIDNTPPAAPAGISIHGGEGWRGDRSFVASWDPVDDGFAPISSVHAETCLQASEACETRVVAGSGNSLELDVPNRGVYELRVWLEDAAGNVDQDRASEPLLLKFDDEAPAAPNISAPSGWLDALEASSPVANLTPGAWEPLSGVAGYSITTDGTSPDASTEVFGRTAAYPLTGLSEGVTTVRAVSVSGAGIPSVEMGEASLRIDRSPPLVGIAGVPSTHGWLVRPVHAEVESFDQPGLSGVAPASDNLPIDAGGYLAIDVGGSRRLIRGSRALIGTADDGHHTLTYRAFDAAGNGSVEKEVRFKIDRTAPVGAFRALDPGDPRELRVDVEDATSGVADGVIEYRRVGGGAYTRLATQREGGLLKARLDDEALSTGRYELRAVVTDVAGNEAIVDTWAGGSSATLAMPLRLTASVSVAGVIKAKACATKASKRGGKGGRRKRPARRKCAIPKDKAVSTLSLGFGKRAATRGRLVTSQGAPIADAGITVEGQARSGGPFVRLGTARTDAHGNFGFKLPAGPSRTIRFRYDGTNTVRSATAQLVTRVRAAARLKTSHRRRRNGQAVRFTGRLLGKPLPRAGKLVALQARVGREWRTFATPRANAKGVFRHRYRFTSTTGVRRYRFRALVAREAAYPYEAGRSRVVRVIVRGR